MNFYFKSIIFEFEHNKSFVKVKIDNNIITCANLQISKDISVLISNINIKFIEFYVSEYDWGLKPLDEYWDTIKNLPIEELPIYRKNNDFMIYLEWANKNFNNNKIRIYETSKFTKRPWVFDHEPNSKSKCLNSVKWEQTNKKFPKFNQLFYHAGDWDDIERFGFLYVRTIYSEPKTIDLTSLSKLNVFAENNTKLELWDKYQFDFDSIVHTMYYMFYKMKKGVMVGIKNNKLAIFLPFSNSEYRNDFYTELYFDSNDKKNLEEYHKAIKYNNKFRIKELEKKLENTLKYYLNKYKLKSQGIFWNRSKWVANDCFFRYEDYEGDKSVPLYEDFFVNLCANRKLPDCVFFLNLRDHPMLNKNLTDSYTNIVNKKLEPEYTFDTYAPILSPGGSIESADICMCTQDDWARVSKQIYPDDCANGYIGDIKLISWDNRIEKGIFRGSATGCGMNEQTNPRIKAAKLSAKYPEYLDAGITSFNRKLKKNLGKPLELVDPRVQGLEKASFMNLETKASYKYILNLDGHVSAFRLAHEFSLGSVLLIPKSQYKLWFSYLLIPWTHYVPIKEDLSDLIDQIKWCKSNDEKCKIIATNGVEFYKKYLDKNGMYDYMQLILSKIAITNSPDKLKLIQSINKSFDTNLPPQIKLTNIVQPTRIALITLYRNKLDNTRLQQKRLFVYLMNKMLSQLCDYDIFVVEQSSKYPFNIGKLKNIGYNYSKKTGKTYSNYIFADIDSIPDSNLIKYFFMQTDSLNSLATFGTRYESLDSKTSRPFVGALISTSSEIFEQLNGYPNNFYGWEGEDTNLLLRLNGIKKPLYVNASGKIIDIEEVEGYKKDIGVKISELNDSKERESMVYEKNINWDNFKSNGLTNLDYTILYENVSEFNSKSSNSSNSSNSPNSPNKTYHIIVDLEYIKSQKKYPNDYEFVLKENIDKHSYKKFINEKIYNIKQIKF
jgi:hypothetical protein